MTAVKVCGLTNLDDARWAAECGADLLGFILVRSSPRYIAPSDLAHIIAVLRAESCQAQFVGVFADEDRETVQQVVQTCGLSYVQLHGDESPAYARGLSVPTIIARRIHMRIPWDEMAAYGAWAYLLDSFDSQRLGGTGHAWRWDLLRADQPQTAGVAQIRVILAGGLNPDNVTFAIHQAMPWGVDVSSGVEAQPGRKDPVKVARFIQCVREEEHANG
jgi:phosphoribosylanthranilate isomerase